MSIEMDASENRKSGFDPPDGGYGWVVVFGGFLVYMLSVGQGFAFGVLFVAFLDAFDATKAEGGKCFDRSLFGKDLRSYSSVRTVFIYSHCQERARGFMYHLVL